VEFTINAFVSGMGNTDISMSMELCKNPKRFSKFTMTVGKHSKVVSCS
jgi:hypothetical protein